MKTLTDRDETPYTAEARNPGTRAVIIPQPAARQLDTALMPFIRPGTPIGFDPAHARLALYESRRAVLVAAAVNGGLTNGRK